MWGTFTSFAVLRNDTPRRGWQANTTGDCRPIRSQAIPRNSQWGAIRGNSERRKIHPVRIFLEPLDLICRKDKMGTLLSIARCGYRIAKPSLQIRKLLRGDRADLIGGRGIRWRVLREP